MSATVRILRTTDIPREKHKSVLTSRGVAKRQREEPNVWEHRVHPSTSVEQSRKWFEKQIAEQMRRGGLFIDPFVEASDVTIGSTRDYYRWLRPHEIVSYPKFISDGISRFDVMQGELGNCWFLAAVACLSMHPELFEHVVPDGQSFDSSEQSQYGTPLSYCGMFWFRFWQFGEWVDVVVDDRLPTRDRNLVFMHSADRCEFWSALLEKAFAKIVGSYEAMRGGSTAEAMEDFTGGLTEVMDLGEKAPANLFSIALTLQTRSSLMACSLDDPDGAIEAEGPMGLITGHAYSITDVRTVHTSHGPVDLVRLRNPWGNEREWRGAWSDQSREWKSISSAERKQIGLTFENDGEFWMSFNDFKNNFTRVEFCHLGPESAVFGRSLSRDTPARRWEMTRETGEWVKFSTAGGCRNNLDSFHMNPQFRVRVTDPDETDEDQMGTIIVGLMQMGRRESRQPPYTIGYAIYSLSDGSHRDGPLGKAFFIANTSVARSPSFTNMREVVGRHKLPAGEYVIIPSTFQPNEEAKFILRIFSECACESNEIDDPTNIQHGFKVSAHPDASALAEKLREAFNDVAGPSGAISHRELADILNAAFTRDIKFDGFSRETCRSMVALMDTDLTGELDFNEFKKLWMDLRVWKSIFKKFDHDQCGSLKAFELRDVLKTIGVTVSNRVRHAIISRYANHNGDIVFDDFILLLVRLVTAVDTYKSQERLRDGRAAFDFEEFTRSVIYM